MDSLLACSRYWRNALPTNHLVTCLLQLSLTLGSNTIWMVFSNWRRRYQKEDNVCFQYFISTKLMSKAGLETNMQDLYQLNLPPVIDFVTKNWLIIITIIQGCTCKIVADQFFGRYISEISIFCIFFSSHILRILQSLLNIH